MDKNYNVSNDPYEYYEALFDPMLNDRQARRKRSPKAHHKPKTNPAQIMMELADELGWENNFEITYKPSLYEADWLFASLRPFFEQSLISDVVSIVKGGKEASVYCCAAHPSMDVDWVAAKVYRPRKFRGLTNDQMYREGRDILTSEGNIIHENKDREARAIGKKTAFGVQLSQNSWLMHEYQALERLHQAGAIVPKPFQVGNNAILMEFIGKDNLAAPTLNSVRLETGEAQIHFDLVMENVELMLKQNLIHADLSAYNILYLQGEIVIIDLPQVVNLQGNRNAPAILARDVMRVCEYFTNQGVKCDAQEISRDFWRRYLRVPGYILRADESQLAARYPDVFGDPLG